MVLSHFIVKYILGCNFSFYKSERGHLLSTHTQKWRSGRGVVLVVFRTDFKYMIIEK